MKHFIDGAEGVQVCMGLHRVYDNGHVQDFEITAIFVVKELVETAGRQRIWSIICWTTNLIDNNLRYVMVSVEKWSDGDAAFEASLLSWISNSYRKNVAVDETHGESIFEKEDLQENEKKNWRTWERQAHRERDQKKRLVWSKWHANLGEEEMMRVMSGRKWWCKRLNHTSKDWRGRKRYTMARCRTGLEYLAVEQYIAT